MRIVANPQEEKARAIAAAAPLTDEEAKSLERKAITHRLEQSEVLALERYHLSRFYEIEQVEVEDVLFDKGGRMQQCIRNLEALDEAIAIQRSAKSIDRNPTTPQDWNRAAMQQWLLEKSGAIVLIQRILTGEVEELSFDLVSPIVEFIQKHSKEFEIGFKFSNIDKVAPMQAIGTLLDWYGIKRERQQCRQEGRVLRRYLINVEHLNKLKAILRRRRGYVTPLLVENLNSGGVTVQNSLEKPSRCETLKLDVSGIPAKFAETFSQMWWAADSDEERSEILGVIRTFREQMTA